MHYGTFSGVMAAAVAGLMCSGFTSVARYAFGYIKNKQYFKGRIWNLKLREDELK
jgi:NhaP-type Na+/H+ or K+/H+ antiporter